MRAPRFWWRRRRSLAAWLLSPLGVFYGAIVARRMARDGEHCGIPVICIGNLTAGGAGKTPLAITVAGLLRDAGETPVFLSRGYGGAHRGPALHVDFEKHNAAEVGDEPLLLARVATTIVCADRVAGAKAAIGAGASVIVMDDGMQNPALHKDLTLAIVDGGVGVGNGLCIPAGPLRAPLWAQWPLVDALVVAGAGRAGEDAAQQALGKPTFPAQLVAEPQLAAQFRGMRVVAFAGIGRPDKFFETLTLLGADIAARRTFADHHRFSSGELKALRLEAKALGARLVTTEKDQVRLPKEFAALATPVRMKIENQAGLRDLLINAIANTRRRG